MSTARWEIAAVLLTGLGNFLLADWLDLRLSFIAGACLFWTLFVAIRVTANPALLREWGFTTRNLGRSLALLAPVLIAATAAFAAYGALAGRSVLNWHILPIGLLYPVWGLVQQFLVVALLAGNMRKHSRIPERWIVLLSSLIFAAAHVPALPLVAAAFFLGVVATTVFFRAGNLWALGLFHGWFATGLYYLVLGRDLWREVVSARLWP